MILCDFLSRQTHANRNLYEIIPILFNTYNVLYKNYYSIDAEDWYLVQMWSQTKVTRIMLPEVYGTKKTLDTNVLPEKQKPQIHREQVYKNKTRLGRDRAGIKCKKTPTCYWHNCINK